jgi:mannosyl-oligosaccharide alpha-1,2-mannosidase
MIRLPRRWYSVLVSFALISAVLFLFRRLNESPYTHPGGLRFAPVFVNKLPTTQPKTFPDIQFKFPKETDEEKDTRSLRQETMKNTFLRAWEGYKQNAWMKDELQPLSGGSVSTFGGWGATLVDTLDTLWIMGMTEEFEQALGEIASIDFNTSDTEILNVFETNIRYLGGLLGAYDISNGQYSTLLTKAVELGDLLYKAFDTPNRMPITRWHWKDPTQARDAGDSVLAAELGSLTLEFTRLSQLTGDSKYYDAIYRVMLAFEQSQQSTRLPGLWPTVINARRLSFDGKHFTISGMVDSLYEYLPKQYMLLGGTVKSYKTMYEKALREMETAIFFRPMVPEPSKKISEGEAADILMAGNAYLDERINKMVREPQGQHLGCFAGGMVALAAKLFNREAEDMSIAQRLVNGCIWAYRSQPTGIMPETFHLVPCENERNCIWDEQKWHSAILARQRVDKSETNPEERVERIIRDNRLKPGYTEIGDRRYILRPEAIESIFVLYRLTGNTQLLDAAWTMFESIEAATETTLGNAAIKDVTVSVEEVQRDDRMESFWMAETLKYFYLIFSTPDVCSLDKFVL